MFRNPYADGLIVLLVILLFFGPKRLPLLGRSLGQGMREFKDSITGDHKDGEDRSEISDAAAPVAASPERTAAPAGEPTSAGTEQSR
jgi:sec-independent protein translocase protein TatA